MKSTQEQPLYLHELVITDALRIEGQLRVAPHGKHVVISGPNAVGKTSAVDCIWAALGGINAKDKPEFIHDGKDQASVELDLGDFTVRRTWPKNGSARLVIKSADGGTIKRPQELLDTVLSRYSFDLLTFLNQRPQDQVDTVLALCGVEPPVAKVNEITSEQHLPKEGETAERYLMRLSADETGEYFVRRRQAHRDVDQKRGALAEAKMELEKFSDSDGVPTESASAILERLQSMNAEQSERQKAEGELTAARRDKQLLENKLQTTLSRQLSIQFEIKELEKKLDVLRTQVLDCETEITTIKVNQNELISWINEEAKRVETMPDHAGEIAICNAQLKSIERHQQEATKRQVAVKMHERLHQELHGIEAEHKRLDDILERLRDLRKHLLDGIDLGVHGLSVGDGELRLDGITFRQASTAQQIKVACAIAMKQHPRLRLLRIDGGERLDSHSWEEIRRHADKNGWQIIMTRVANHDGLKVEIIDSREAGDDSDVESQLAEATA